jgi:hypothetical protein
MNKPKRRLRMIMTTFSCMVVKYTDPINRWHYLLHCGL